MITLLFPEFLLITNAQFVRASKLYKVVSDEEEEEEQFYPSENDGRIMSYLDEIMQLPHVRERLEKHRNNEGEMDQK